MWDSVGGGGGRGSAESSPGLSDTMRAAVKMEGHETPDWNNYYSEAPEVGPLIRF